MLERLSGEIISLPPASPEKLGDFMQGRGDLERNRILDAEQSLKKLQDPQNKHCKQNKLGIRPPPRVLREGDQTR